MKASTLSDKASTKILFRAMVILFWLGLWQLSSMALSQELLLVSPITVLRRLAVLITEVSFWKTISFSFARICAGFFSSVFAGIVLSAAAARFRLIRELLSPLMAAIKASPVASFIILLLIWIPSHSLSIAISFLMVLPIIYTNLSEGIAAVDCDMLELASVFKVSGIRKLRYLYLSQVLPFFRSACAVSLGMCWKSGIAAEVIGIPKGSIGERLYQAKIYLDTPDLFAWTVVIVLMSILFGRLFLTVLDSFVRKLERM